MSLNSPERIQSFLDSRLGYNKERGGETCYSPRNVIRYQVAHCLEGAVFAAAAMRLHGSPPLVLDLEAINDDDHVVALFKYRNHWGAIAKSNYAGLRFREPVYRSLRELVMSYFEHYYNAARQKTLRAYSRPVNLSRFDDRSWMISEDHIWFLADHLVMVPHRSVLPKGIRRISRVDKRLYAAGLVGQVV